MKKLLVVLTLVLGFSVCSCGLIGGGKGKQLSKEEWDTIKTNMSLATNYTSEYHDKIDNIEKNFTVMEFKQNRYREGNKGYYYSYDKRGDMVREGDNYFGIYEHTFGHIVNNLLYSDMFSYSSDPEGSFRYYDVNGEEKVEYLSNFTDEELFNVMWYEYVPSLVKGLPSYDSVEWNASKGCFIDSKGGEYYVNGDGLVTQYKYVNQYFMAGVKVKETETLTIKYGSTQIKNFPTINGLGSY